jgi:5-methylcytosine-specific restriction protein A
MPSQFCAAPGCGVLVPKGRCPTHARVKEQQRPNRIIRRLYYRDRWKRERERVLVECGYTCAQCGVIHSQLEVDHIVKHDGDPELFWNRNNLQALCSDCHHRKTGLGM